MKIKHTFIPILFLSLSLPALAQEIIECAPKRQVFNAGEKVKYVLTYNWFLVWTDVGEVTFEVNDDYIYNKPAYHLRGFGKTYKFYDWFYQVRDIYETWVDKEHLRPMYYKRDVNEDEYHIDITYRYNWKDSVAYAKSKKTNKDLKKDTIKLPYCTQDIMSIVYHLRNLDYTKYEKDEKIPINILLDSKVEQIYLRYQKKEKKRVRGVGKFNTIKFTGYLVKGSIFKGGEDLEVWVTDDKNRIPVWIESPIKVGKIKARLVDYEGLKYEVNSKIK